MTSSSMGLPLAGRVALVTGATSGIGAAVAEELSCLGATLALTARRADALQATAERFGDGVRTYVADLTDAAAVERLVPAVIADVGGVDVLVNNAGVANLAPADALELAALDEEIAVNFRAPAVLCRAVLPGMRQRSYGRIVNISSEAGVTALAGMAGYCATKRALNALTEVIQEENGEYGIKAWAVCPGMVDTSGGDDRGRADRDKFLTAGDVATTVAWLLTSPERARLGPEIRLRTQRNPWSGRPTDWSKDLTS